LGALIQREDKTLTRSSTDERGKIKFQYHLILMKPGAKRPGLSP
jgi:hypothetical protein